MIDYLAAREAAIDRKVAAVERALDLRILARLAAKKQAHDRR
jgi:hypothetical protein